MKGVSIGLRLCKGVVYIRGNSGNLDRGVVDFIKDCLSKRLQLPCRVIYWIRLTVRGSDLIALKNGIGDQFRVFLGNGHVLTFQFCLHLWNNFGLELCNAYGSWTLLTVRCGPRLSATLAPWVHPLPMVADSSASGGGIRD